MEELLETDGVDVLAKPWLGKPRILIAEDDQDLAMGLKITLSGSFDVATHAYAADALRFCDEHFPDLLIVDYVLPDLSGVILLRTLRQSCRGYAPAIMISAHTDRKEIALRNGFDAFIPKPIEQENLMRVIRKSIGVEWPI